MNRIIRFTSTLLLSGALVVPIGVLAQDRDNERDDHNKNYRVYDRDHRDYHNWNSDEDNSYRQWYGQNYNGRQYREYGTLHKKDQQAYWNYRHNNDHDRDHDKDHDKDRH